MHTRAQFIRHALMLMALASPLLPGCSSQEEGDHHDEEDHSTHEDHTDVHTEDHPPGAVRVHLESAALEVAGIDVEAVRQSVEQGTIRLPAVVKVKGDGMARVGSVVSGRVVRLYVGEGTWIGRGGRMAEIESPDVGLVRAEYLDAAAAERRARAELERQERLAEENIGAGRNLETARAAVEQAVAAKREAAAHLRLLGIDPARAGSSSSNRIAITAPISGIVASRPVTLGEFVEPSDDIFTLVNTSSVWVDAQATAAQVARLASGGVGFVVGPGGERRSGRIIYVSPTLDPESRTATVRVEVTNPEGTLRPGSFVTLDVQTEGGRSVVTLPSTAVDREGEETYVWRPEGEGTFERVAIEPGVGIGDRMVVLSGIAEGDTVVTAGVFYLRSALKGGELSEHHH